MARSDGWTLSPLSQALYPFARSPVVIGTGRFFRALFPLSPFNSFFPSSTEMVCLPPIVGEHFPASFFPFFFIR